MGVTESVKTVNSVLRTLIALGALGIVGLGGYLGYEALHGPERELQAKQDQIDAIQADLDRRSADLAQARNQLVETEKEVVALNETIVEKDEEIAVKDAEIEKISTALKLLKVDHRIAELTVLEQGQRPDSEETYSKVKFVEVNEEGVPIDEPKVFELVGDVIYIDYWLVQFEDKYVESADLDRSTSICLFRRVFDEVGGPQAGHQLDEPGSRPNAYARGGKMSEFERKIWDDFWNIANDPERAQELGIRAAHGQASYTKVREGMTYRLLLRASGGLTITPEEGVPPEPAG